MTFGGVTITSGAIISPPSAARTTRTISPVVVTPPTTTRVAVPKEETGTAEPLELSMLKDAPVPVCAACLYGKATRKPWRTKPKKVDKDKLRKATAPGQIVSVDMLVSPVPGLIAQMAGWITGKRYKYAAVYVDNYSGFSYVHLQKTQSAEETLQGKELFERKSGTFGVKIQHYHADNGIFLCKAWKEACAKSRQGCSYAGVNAHFQSGTAERRIRELSELSRTSLTHSNSRWPEAVNVHLWPYAVRTANDSYNEAPTSKLKRSPIELFSNSQVMPDPKFQRPFGCPCYVLDSALQTAGGKKNKWEDRSRVGVYLPFILLSSCRL